MPKFLDKETSEALGEPEDHRVKRSHGRDLKFRGWKIGVGAAGSGGSSGYRSDWNRGRDVRIWLTTGGNIVIGRYRWSCWQGESDSYEADSFGTVEAALDHLQDADYFHYGLGPAEKEAWEEACATVPSLSGQDVEIVE